MPSLLYLLFYDAFSNHAFVFLCVSMHLETDLPTPQETPTQRLSMGLKSETQVSYIDRARFAVGEPGTSTQSISSFGIFFSWIIFLGIGPPPSPRVLEQIELQAELLNYFLGSNKNNINQLHTASSYYRVNYT